MTATRSRALRIGFAALAALALLQLIWHWPTGTGRDTWLLPVATVIPLLPGLWVSMHNLRRGVLIGGIVCLLYFCHAIVTAWAEPGARGIALLELALTLVVISASGWDARNFRRNRSRSR